MRIYRAWDFLVTAQKNMTKEEVRVLINNTRNLSFGYVNGRVLKVYISKDQAWPRNWYQHLENKNLLKNLRHLKISLFLNFIFHEKYIFVIIRISLRQMGHLDFRAFISEQPSQRQQ